MFALLTLFIGISHAQIFAPNAKIEFDWLKNQLHFVSDEGSESKTVDLSTVEVCFLNNQGPCSKVYRKVARGEKIKFLLTDATGMINVEAKIGDSATIRNKAGKKIATVKVRKVKVLSLEKDGNKYHAFTDTESPFIFENNQKITFGSDAVSVNFKGNPRRPQIEEVRTLFHSDNKNIKVDGMDEEIPFKTYGLNDLSLKTHGGHTLSIYRAELFPTVSVRGGLSGFREGESIKYGKSFRGSVDSGKFYGFGLSADYQHLAYGDSSVMSFLNTSINSPRISLGSYLYGRVGLSLFQTDNGSTPGALLRLETTGLFNRFLFMELQLNYFSPSMIWIEYNFSNSGDTINHTSMGICAPLSKQFYLCPSIRNTNYNENNNYFSAVSGALELEFRW